MTPRGGVVVGQAQRLGHSSKMPASVYDVKVGCESDPTRCTRAAFAASLMGAYYPKVNNKCKGQVNKCKGQGKCKGRDPIPPPPLRVGWRSTYRDTRAVLRGDRLSVCMTACHR